MLSNSSTNVVRDLYTGYEQVEVRATRAISSRGAERGPIPELLVMNYHRQ
jgi:DNA adenine methylase